MSETAVPAGLDSVTAIAAGYGHTVALVEKCASAVAVPNRARQNPLRGVVLSCKAGNIFFSSPLPAAAVFTLFDLNGRVMYRGNVQGPSLRLPRLTHSRVALWRVENQKISSSGRITVW